MIFEDISKSPSPDLALNDLGVLIAAHRFPEQLFVALKEEGFRKLIFTVCGSSPRLTRGLAKDKLLFDLLASDRASLAQPWNGKRRRNEKLVVLKEREELRAGIRYVLGISSFRDFTTELSRLADEAIASVFAGECKTRGLRRPALAIFALGKYGTRELSIDADLDVLFVGDQKAKSSDRYEKIASGIIQRLSSGGSGGKLYDVDARLRPEGRSAPLVVDKKMYATYLHERASLWERQSLTRMRFVCGDASLAEGVASAVTSFVYETPLRVAWTDEIVAMRRKVETRSHTRPSDFFDVKLGSGGMVDIEFIAQMIQLKFGATIPALRFLPTTDVLEIAPSAVLSSERASFLKHTYGLYRRIELMMRLSLEDRSTILPMGDKLELLSGILGVSTSAELRTTVSENMKDVRSLFLQIAKVLSLSD
jgi:glutamate-ammonia-ligase adenylyltransferase